MVADASVAVAALIDPGERGDWAGELLRGAVLVAPALMPFEVANVIRRKVAAGALSVELGASAVAQLVAYRPQLWPYEQLSARIWALRGSMTAYDAAYVATAEAARLVLVTLDERLVRAPGARCQVQTFPG